MIMWYHLYNQGGKSKQTKKFVYEQQTVTDTK